MFHWRFPLLFACSLLAACATTAPTDLRTTLRESVVMIPTPGLIAAVKLETTIFRPPGDGPHQVVLFNHGKAKGDPAYQRRARPLLAVREFLNRGYAVVVPMRQGFSNSTGFYKSAGCHFARNGLRQAEDIRHVIDYLATQPDLDTSQLVVMGQSHGGLTTMALGTLQLPNVVGLVNFAGGLRNDNCTDSDKQLARYMASYAASTRVPSLWFYGTNDSVFPTETWQSMHAQYQQAGGKARLVNFGEFKGDAHGMFGHRDGLPIWVPEVSKFMTQLGMSFVIKHDLALATHNKSVPPPSGFANLGDFDSLPVKLNKITPERYQRFLSAPPPKALAISPTGAWGWSAEVPDAMQRALDRCNKHSKSDCRLYAVDDNVVW